MRNNNDTIILGDAIEYVNKSILNNEYVTIKSGIETLDAFTGGWYPGELCIIGGRPLMGKTAFVLSAISNLVISNIPVALFSATDSMNLHFMSRVVSCMKFQNNSHILERKLDIMNSFNMQGVPLYLNLQPYLKLIYIKEHCERLIKEKGVKIIFIETIQKIFDSEENGNSKENMEAICHKLKCMANDLNVPIIVTSDLNRSPEHREGYDGKIPQIADLRSCSAIENNADSIYLLFRPEYYRILSDETGKNLKGLMNVIIAKQKYNKTGEIETGFDHAKSRIFDLNDYRIYEEIRHDISNGRFIDGPF